MLLLPVSRQCTSFRVPSVQSFLTFLYLQIDRIINKPVVHAPGPKRPDLAQIDGKDK